MDASELRSTGNIETLHPALGKRIIAKAIAFAAEPKDIVELAGDDIEHHVMAKGAVGNSVPALHGPPLGITAQLIKAVAFRANPVIAVLIMKQSPCLLADVEVRKISEKIAVEVKRTAAVGVDASAVRSSPKHVLVAVVTQIKDAERNVEQPHVAGRRGYHHGSFAFESDDDAVICTDKATYKAAHMRRRIDATDKFQFAQICVEHINSVVLVDDIKAAAGCLAHILNGRIERKSILMYEPPLARFFGTIRKRQQIVRTCHKQTLIAVKCKTYNIGVLYSRQFGRYEFPFLAVIIIESAVCLHCHSHTRRRHGALI